MNNEVIVMLIRAGMVLVNIRIWKDFILARDSGLIPIGRIVARPESGKPIPEFYKTGKPSGLISKNDSEDKELRKKSFLEEIQSKEVIEILSESEKETSEQKSEVDFSWKYRLPKQCSKYVPESPSIKQQLANEGWLTKRSPSDWLNIPNAIEPFRKEMSSKDAWPFESGNQRDMASLSATNPYMTKLSSNITSFSSSSSNLVSKPIAALSNIQYGSGKELRPRVIQEALSKL
jgi:hypothetical protein